MVRSIEWRCYTGDYTITTDYHEKEGKKSVDFEIKCP